jgi:hypothetical protein
MPASYLTPDCSNCDALCCVLLAFDASDAFAVNKPACKACHHLRGDNSCEIHAELPDHGYKGCTAYTCYGAGQRITQSVFKGRSWRDDAAILPAMEDSFRRLRRLHEAAWLLREAASLALPQDTEQRRRDLLAALDANRDWTEASLRAFEAGGGLKAVPTFLASLRDLAVVKPPRR